MNTVRVAGVDPEGRIAALRREHSELEARLVALKRNVRLTAAEEIEVRKIKRQKLNKKDEIARLSSLLNQE